ncbi:alpha/beta fold hydrolase [Streptomyces sp. NPDC050264]|uniref:alpha/beta fold hydrolase n=1 Tax=Streptomyces sp. NPDC050264 TaxID=3155038 RepID=UPI0034375956
MAAQERTQDQVPVSLYPQLDEAALTQFVRALESGDTTGLSTDRTAQAGEARARLELRRVRVPGAGRVHLAGFLWKHRDSQDRPVVVMPSPWTDLGWIAYAMQGTRFALDGYHVLAYTARGFGHSEGEVEVAGPLDVADGSSALTFLYEEAGGAATRAGFVGDSYGSGISQLVAAHDDRVNAVAAMSTWGDLGQAFYENDTRHVASARVLRKAAANARLSARTQQAFDALLGGGDMEETLEWAAERSPYAYRERLNERQVPVFFANAWHETLFPGNQTLQMFNALTGPKRINLSIGDHSCPEMSGFLGLPNRIWRDAHRWMDHFVKQEPNGIDEEGQLLSQIMWSSTLEASPNWQQATGKAHRFHLTGAGAGGDAALIDKPETGWTRTIRVGTDTPATVADAIIKRGYAELAGDPKVYPTGDISRSDAGVWVTAPLTRTTRLRGIPELHLTCTASSGPSMFVAYLFDVSPDASAHIVTQAPFTRPGSTPADRPGGVHVPLQVTGYDVAAGHRLMLVLDTVDPFYAKVGQRGTTLTVTSPDADPSYLDVPIA